MTRYAAERFSRMTSLLLVGPGDRRHEAPVGRGRDAVHSRYPGAARREVQQGLADRVEADYAAVHEAEDRDRAAGIEGRDYGREL